MKLIVIDLDRLGAKTDCPFHNKQILKAINENKICTLTKDDFGKKVLIGLPEGDADCLEAKREYDDSIFHLKDDDHALKHENKMFRTLLKKGKIKYFRVGMVIKRDKALKILQRMLGIA